MLTIALLASLQAPTLPTEQDYVQAYCSAPYVEVTVNAKVDCIDGHRVIDFAFDDELFTALRTSMNNAAVTGLRASIVVIMRTNGAEKNVEFLRHIITQHRLPIDVAMIQDAI